MRKPLYPAAHCLACKTTCFAEYYALEEDEDGFQYLKRYAVTWKVE